MSNASRCRTYYQKLKADPERWKAFMEKRAVYKSGAREPCEPCEPRGKISPEERAALLAAFDEPVAQQVPLSDHPFIKDLQERIPCTFVNELPPKEKPQ